MPLTRIKSLGITDGAVTIADLAATGTPSATTFLRGDNSWVAAGGVNTPAFSAYLTGATSIANTTYTEVLFNGEYFDTNNLYSVSTGRFTPTTAGKYFFYSSVIIDSIGDQKFIINELRQNGGLFSYSQTFMSGASGNLSTCAYGAVTMNGTTDYVSVFIYHNKGSATNIFTPSVFGGFKIIE